MSDPKKFKNIRQVVDPSTGKVTMSDGKNVLKETFDGAAPDQGDLELMLKGYGRTTAEFFYGMPDSPNVINSLTTQFYDVAPDYPRLFEMIEFWSEEIEGPLRSVQFTHSTMLKPAEIHPNVSESIIHGERRLDGDTSPHIQ